MDFSDIYMQYTLHAYLIEQAYHLRIPSAVDRYAIIECDDVEYGSLPAAIAPKGGRILRSQAGRYMTSSAVSFHIFRLSEAVSSSGQDLRYLFYLARLTLISAEPACNRPWILPHLGTRLRLLALLHHGEAQSRLHDQVEKRLRDPAPGIWSECYRHLSLGVVTNRLIQLWKT